MTQIDINGILIKDFKNANFFISEKNNERVKGFKLGRTFKNSDLKDTIEANNIFNIIMVNKEDMSVIAELKNAKLDEYSFYEDEEKCTFTGDLIINK